MQMHLHTRQILFYKNSSSACQVGNKEIVKVLLQHGADGRYHSVTKYSPLYIACYHGHHEIVELLLFKFPELVQVRKLKKLL